jgi:serine/threonine-protein kinase
VNAPVREGEILAGKYRVERVLGVGGMGVVVAAHHVELDERVAIKFLLAETLTNADAVSRFSREARAAVKIKSEHVARVSDVGRLGNGAPYIVMEYLEGVDLSAWVRDRGRLSVEQAVEFVLQASEAIAEAHALGIIHRDLKPANLFVIRRPDGMLSVKVLDFGISKMTGAVGQGSNVSVTQTSGMMGSPLYMSPEQMQSAKDVDVRSDIWALGIILYELISGDTPFGGSTIPELVLGIVQGRPKPLRNKLPDAPDGLETVIFRCLDKDRGRRYQSVGELAVALLPFGPRRSKSSVDRIAGVMSAAGLSSTALALPPSSDDRDELVAGTGTVAPWGRTTVGKGRGRWLMIAGVGAVVIAAGIAATLLRSRSGVDPVASASAAAALPAAPEDVAARSLPIANSAEPSPLVAPADSAAQANAAVPAASVAPAPTLDTPPAPFVHVSRKSPGAAHPAIAAAPTRAQPNPAPPPAVTPRPTAPPATTSAPAPHGPDCTQKYYFDAQGNKHFRPECFGKN